jgi:hypothetical protein
MEAVVQITDQRFVAMYYVFLFSIDFFELDCKPEDLERVSVKGRTLTGKQISFITILGNVVWKRFNSTLCMSHLLLSGKHYYEVRLDKLTGYNVSIGVTLAQSRHRHDFLGKFSGRIPHYFHF